MYGLLICWVFPIFFWFCWKNFFFDSLLIFSRTNNQNSKAAQMNFFRFVSLRWWNLILYFLHPKWPISLFEVHFWFSFEFSLFIFLFRRNKTQFYLEFEFFFHLLCPVEVVWLCLSTSTSTSTVYRVLNDIEIEKIYTIRNSQFAVTKQKKKSEKITTTYTLFVLFINWHICVLFLWMYAMKLVRTDFDSFMCFSIHHKNDC